MRERGVTVDPSHLLRVVKFLVRDDIQKKIDKDEELRVSAAVLKEKLKFFRDMAPCDTPPGQWCNLCEVVHCIPMMTRHYYNYVDKCRHCGHDRSKGVIDEEPDNEREELAG